MQFVFRSLAALVLLASTIYAFAAEPMSAPSGTKALPPAQQAQIVAGYGKLPLSFEPNQGQADPQVKFLSRGDGYDLALTSSEAILSLGGRHCSPSLHRSAAPRRPADKLQPCTDSAEAVLRMSLLGSNPNAKLRGDVELPGKSNYFLGKDPSVWHTNIPTYRKVRYQGVYPGIDLAYYGNKRQLEHDFIVAPGADPRAIRLSFPGAKKVFVDEKGNLVLATEEGSVRLERPLIYQQQKNGAKKPVVGRFKRYNSSDIGFAIGAYDKTKELVIDPVMTYSTFVGGASFSIPIGVSVDSFGNAFVVARSSIHKVVNAVLVTKVDQSGSQQLYSTLISSALAYGMAVDATGNAYVTGLTESDSFPTVNAFQEHRNGFNSAAFVTKIDPSGAKLVYSTYFGTYAYGSAIAVDAVGSAYLTGVAFSGVPVLTSLSDGPGPFITKFSPSGSSLEYSTYISSGQNTYDISSNAIAVDTAGEAVITGETRFKGFPTKNALYRKCVRNESLPCDDIFVTKLNASGTGLVYSTFLGPGAGVAVATNADGDAFVGGRATVEGFPLVNSLYPGGSYDNLAFITRINAAGSALVYSTFLSPHMGLSSLAVDNESDVYATGFADADLPVVNAIQPQFGGGGADAGVIKINGSGSQVLYSTFLGGSKTEGGQSIAADAYGGAYVIGNTFSTDFPLKNQIPAPANPEPTFLAKISESGVFTVANSVDHTIVGPGGPLNYTITVTNTGCVEASGVLTDRTVRGPILSCRVSNGDQCKFVFRTGTATVSFSPFAPGESRTISISAHAATNAGDYNIVRNIAALYSGPPIYERDFAAAPVTVRETANIGITSKLIDSTNGLLHYAHTVTNLGPDNAHAVLLLDPLPPGTQFVSTSTTAGKCSFHPTIGGHGAVRCTLDNPNAGSSVQADIFVQANGATCDGLVNTASVTSQSIDTESGNDSATITTKLPQKGCSAPGAYTVATFDSNDLRSHAYHLNNKGDLIGQGPAGGPFLYLNGATTPLYLPLTHASNFNDLDDVIGTNAERTAGLYKNGTFQALDFGKRFRFGSPEAVNDLDQIIGYDTGQNGDYVGFIYSNGKTRDLGRLPGTTDTIPHYLNNKGEVTGLTFPGPDSFFYTHGLLLKIRADLPSQAVDPAALDSSGRVSGTFAGSLISNGLHPFVYSAGKFEDLGSAAGTFPLVRGMNDCGEVVGFDLESSHGAFLYRNGTFITLDDIHTLPPGYSLQPLGINNLGQILADSPGPNAQGTSTKFLLTPTVLEKCGSDATIDNNPDLATITAGGNITYTIKAANLDTATTQFTVNDALDPTTTVISCTVTGGGGTCTAVPGSHTASATLPSLAKGSTATITIKVKTASTYTAQSVIINTATLSSNLTSDYLSTAYTSVP